MAQTIDQVNNVSPQATRLEGAFGAETVAAAGSGPAAPIRPYGARQDQIMKQIQESIQNSYSTSRADA